MMRVPSLLILSLALAAGPAWAQQTLGQTPVIPVPEGKPNPDANAPLSTGPRPGDIPTTTPQTAPSSPDGDAPSDDRQGAPLTTQAPGPRPADVAGSLSPVAGLTTEEARALIGREVLSREGEAVGTLRDFLTAGSNARLEAAIIGQGGLLGVGQRLVRVPVDQLQVRRPPAGEVPSLTLSRTAAEVEAAPAFTYQEGAKAMVGPGR
ncbi:PRC-barrel domain-containing protein [Aerophototrophica crusticola]